MQLPTIPMLPATSAPPPACHPCCLTLVLCCARSANGGDAEVGSKKGEEVAEDEDAAHGATPGFLQTMRKSKVWKSVTHSINTDIHDVVESDAAVS